MARHPHVSPVVLAARLPDVIVLYLPVSVPFVVLGSLLATLHYLEQRAMFAQIELAGVRAHVVFAPVLVVVALVCTAMVGVNAHVLPQIRYQLLHLVENASADMGALALRLAEDPGFLSGYRIRFDSLDGDSLTNVRLTGGSESNSVAVFARTASIGRVPDTPFLELTLRDGRLLRVSSDLALQQNAQFERLHLRRDVRSLGGPDKTELISLSHYTDEELGRLGDLMVYRLQRGIRPSPAQRRRVAGVETEKWSRRQSAGLSLIFALVALAGLVDHTRIRRRARAVVVVAGCLVALMPAQLILESGAHRGSLASPWLVFTPSLAAALLFGLLVALRPRTVRLERASP